MSGELIGKVIGGIVIGGVIIYGVDKLIKNVFYEQVEGSTSEGTEDANQNGGRRSRRQRKGGTRRR